MSERNRTVGSSVILVVSVLLVCVFGSSRKITVAHSSASPVPKGASITASGSPVLDYSEPIAAKTGMGPGYLAVGNFNRDALLDIVTVNTSSDNISVLMGHENGVFSDATQYSISGQKPYSAAVGRLNGDPYPDIVTANLSTSNLSVFYNNANGEFRPPVTIDTGAGPIFVACGDLNADGREDIATVSLGLETVEVFFNQTDGKFRKALALPSLGANPRTLAIRDLNKDGLNDIAVANAGAKNVTVFLSQGGGRFGEGRSYETGAGPTGLSVGDVNGDGLPDLATANEESNTVSVLVNKGDGSFGHSRDYDVKRPSAITMADLNDDRESDLVVSQMNTGSVSVLLSRANDGFSDPISIPAQGDSIASVAVGDFNRDGKPDIAMVDAASNTMSVLLYGVHAPRVESVFPTSNDKVGLAGKNIDKEITAKFSTALDPKSLNNDTVLVYGAISGFHPVNVSYNEKNKTVSLKPDDTRIFQAGETVNVEFTNRVRSREGLPAPGAYNTTFTVKPRAGNANFAESEQIDCDKIPGRLRVADFDNDGHPDIVALCREVDGIRVHFNDGTGHFTGTGHHDPHSFLSTKGYGPWDLWAADINRDGLIDIVVVNTFSSDMVVFYNKGNRHFADPVKMACGAGPMSVRVADLNGDGYPDIVAATKGFPAAIEFLNDTRGGFLKPVSFAVAPSPYDISARDINGDGSLDLVMTNLESDRGTILLNKGDGTFNKPDEFPLLIAKALVEEPIDVNNDGLTDVVAVNTASDDISVLINRGKGQFQDQKKYGAGPTPTDKAFGDFNNDGAVDIAITLDGGT
ncbi:MAG TPA: FG-GAP-like repeat-containing protein, partial [Blastocatellia bacterium]|nr:FG-GAP-like repeat-containing protein [Blastocatellia bacterium]